VVEANLDVALIGVGDDVLEGLRQVATTDASADEVTPPLTAGTAWTPIRIAWLRDFHRDRRGGLDGSAREATWAITVERQVVGSVRLQRTDQPDLLETGVWLACRARGRGIARAAMAAALNEAAEVGATAVRAETTRGNAAALAVLEGLGFDLPAAPDGKAVHARVVLRPQRPTLATEDR